MAAEAGNKYAEKWTKEAVMDTLNVIYESAKMHGIYYIGAALAQVGLYHQWYSEMAIKFKEDPDVSDAIKKIDQAFEAKLVGKTLNGDLNPTMAIFTLKNKHQWKDKFEQGFTDNQGNDVKVNFYLPDNGRGKGNQTSEGVSGKGTE